jgi:uncharacterized membrane protein YraQ (UPF0718 family)
MLLLENFWQLFLISAPWLLLGLFIAGLINVYLPKDFLIKHLGSDGLLTTIKAAIIGAPMPLCSCGVIPAALGLRRAGASKSATTAFLVSTPETGVDSISVSYVLLGPFMAIIRPIAAVTSAIVAGVLVGRDHSDNNGEQSDCETNSEVNTENSAPVKIACCGSKKAEPVQSSCCGSSNKMAVSPSAADKFFEAVAFSCTKLLEDTAKWLLIGLFFAALVQTYVPADFFLQWGSGILAMVAVILVSIPMYICATASTPIAAGLLLSGVSPGAVLVFMLAGPATNVATLGVVANELGKRAVASYLIGVIGVAVLFGLLTDFLVERFGIDVAPMIGEHHEVLPEWLMLITAFLLIGLLLRLVIRNFTQPKQVHSH